MLPPQCEVILFRRLENWISVVGGMERLQRSILANKYDPSRPVPTSATGIVGIAEWSVLTEFRRMPAPDRGRQFRD
jgi:hypothetical protein